VELVRDATEVRALVEGHLARADTAARVEQLDRATP